MRFSVWRICHACVELRCETPADADTLQQLLQCHGYEATRVRDDELTVILHAAAKAAKAAPTIQKQPGVEP